MHGMSGMKCFCALICVMIALSQFSSATPLYSDYDSNVRDLLEMLMQRDAIDDRIGVHQVSRKAGRSPQLRLRFGKRPDDTFLPEGVVENKFVRKSPQLRLRFGKRPDSDFPPVPSFVLAGSEQGEN